MFVRQALVWLAVVGCGCACAASAGADEAAGLRGAVTDVTVYQGQALVTRTVEVPDPPGLREVVVTGLPERLLPGSLFAESADGVEVRSVRYRVRAVEEDVREEVRKLDAEIQGTSDAIAANGRAVQTLAEQTAYLAKLDAFVAPTAQTELTHGVLNSDTLTALSQFLFTERKRIAQEELAASIESRALQVKLDTLNRQRAELTAGSANTVREAVVFCNVTGGEGQLRLRYLVDSASWSPSYNARTKGNEQLGLEYNASISQMTGEDWSDVRMTLSTATPSLLSRAPMLEPLAIHLTPQQLEAQTADMRADYDLAKKEIAERLSKAGRDRSSLNFAASPPAGSAGQAQDELRQQLASVQQADALLNSVARELQCLEWTSVGRIERPQGRAEAPNGEGFSVSYELPGRTSLPSRNDRQLIQIASLDLQGDFYRVAVPVLTPYVYREAKLANASHNVLLAGPVATYVDGQFMGSSDLPTVAAGQSFTVGLGIDSSLKATRSLVRKTQSVEAGNRVIDFTYELAIENFGAQPVQVRLLDRMPTSVDSEARLTLVSTGKPLSDNADYQQTERKKGLLRWDVEVPAEAQGLQAFKLEYGLKIEHDKQLMIANLPAPQQQ